MERPIKHMGLLVIIGLIIPFAAIAFIGLGIDTSAWLVMGK